MGWLVFLTTVAVIPHFPDGATGTRWAVLSIALPVMFLFTRQLMATWGHVLIIAFLVWCGATLAWAPFYQGVYVYWHLVLFALAVLIAAESDFDVKAVYLGAGLALVANSVVVVTQVLGYELVPSVTPPAGLFYNKNISAEIAALVLIGLLGCRQYLLAALMTPPLVVAPLSRAPLVALCVVAVAWLWPRRRFLAVLAAILAVGAVVALVGMPSRITAGEHRMMLWHDAVQNLTPLGHGVGGFSWSYPWFEFAHNDALQVAYETGIVGLVLLVAFFAFCFRGAAETERLVLLAFLVEGCFGFPLFVPSSVLVAGLVAGAACRGRRLVRDLLPER